MRNFHVMSVSDKESAYRQFLFSMYINDLEGELMQNGIDGIDIGMLKLYLLLYADDIVIFSMSSEGLQKGLDVLCDLVRDGN